MNMFLSFALILLSLSSSLASSCTGKADQSCEADYSDKYCGMCSSTSIYCANGYYVGNLNGKDVATVGEVCGKSSLVNINDPSKTFNKQMCCPSGKYGNATYSCSSYSSSSFVGPDGTYKGSMYSCEPDNNDAIVAGFAIAGTLLILFLCMIPWICICAIIGVGCTIHWCCVRRKIYIERQNTIVMASPAATVGYGDYGGYSQPLVGGGQKNSFSQMF